MNKAPATLAGKPGTRRARKLPEQVRVRFARTPGICRTLEGDVRYGTIEMHQGAGIDGEVRTIKPSEERPALKLAASSQM